MDYLADAAGLAGWWVLTEAWSWAAILSSFFAVLFTRHFLGREAMNELLKSLGIALLTALATSGCFFVFYFVYSSPRHLLAESEAKLTQALKAPRLIYSEAEENTAWPNSPYRDGKRIIIQSNTEKTPFGIRFFLDKPVDHIQCSFLHPNFQIRDAKQYGATGDESGRVKECRFGGGIGPENPMLVLMFSKEPFTVVSWEEIQQP